MNKPDTKPSLIDDDGEVGELTDAWFEGATLHENGAVKRRPGQRGPGKRVAKQIVTLRLDPDVIDKFKSTGPGWQSRMNEALREAKVEAA